ncbi:MAG: hypothetical protein AAFN94_08580 [Pseudomonadota bacterium]
MSMQDTGGNAQDMFTLISRQRPALFAVLMTNGLGDPAQLGPRGPADGLAFNTFTETGTRHNHATAQSDLRLVADGAHHRRGSRCFTVHHVR